eukprot:TRINITY_DN26959_c0_g1_i1.p1 TRINITY_DN26959_c0_g1~~TRINITY_DN26959_c0_g1_i1.p1  ORF type:complete len:1068 (+),score=141.86 TRINITY_DN26959_c0_g1_i1:230-3205(+)
MSDSGEFHEGGRHVVEIETLCASLDDLRINFCAEHEAVVTKIRGSASHVNEDLSSYRASMRARRRVSSGACSTEGEDDDSFVNADSIASKSVHSQDNHLIWHKGSKTVPSHCGDEQAGQVMDVQTAGPVTDLQSEEMSVMAVLPAKEDPEGMTSNGQNRRSAAYRSSQQTSALSGRSALPRFALRPDWLVDAFTHRCVFDARSSCLQRPRVTNIAMLEEHDRLTAISKASSKSFNVPIRPDSWIRIMWSVASAAVIFYDLVLAPIEICMADHAFQDFYNFTTVNQIIRVFWTADIIMNFSTGFSNVYSEPVMDFKAVARAYMRSWFVFDLFCVIIDWLFLFFHQAGSPAVIFRPVRGFRALRSVWRFARPARDTVVARLIREVILLNSVTVISIWDIMKSALAALLTLHYFACLWLFLTHQAERESRDSEALVGTRYVESLKWTFTHIMGAGSDADGTTFANSLEGGIFVIVLSFTMLCHMTVIFARVYCLLCLFQSSQLAEEMKQCNRFLVLRRIGTSNAVRVKNYLRWKGQPSILAKEARFLQSLPLVLQYDLLFEIQRPVLTKHQFFSDLDDANQRVTRQLALEAVKEISTLRHEKLFHPGDACSRCLFFVSGDLEYVASTFTSVDDWDFSMGKTQAVRKGTVLSEVVLWTEWEHSGMLQACQESKVVAVDSQNFAAVIRQHRQAFVHAVKYAKHAVSMLNKNDMFVSDIFELSLSIAEIDEAINHSHPHDHYCFISHYKQEAGTEATLIKEEMTSLIQSDATNPAADLATPVFCDSEDLDDLSSLQSHVEHSLALVLLLTNGIFRRPWCLIELVTAFRAQVRIVPVEVQSRRLAFVYPGENFYIKLSKGECLTDSDVALLSRAGMSLMECEKAVRHVFTKIALPFSPHKSRIVRDAEMKDVIWRIAHPGPSDENPSFREKPKASTATFGSTVILENDRLTRRTIASSGTPSARKQPEKLASKMTRFSAVQASEIDEAIEEDQFHESV